MPRKAKNKSNEPSAPQGSRELVVIAKAEASLRATPQGVTSAAGVDVASLEAVIGDVGVSMRPLYGVSEDRMDQKSPSASELQTFHAMSQFYEVVASDDELDSLAEKLLTVDVVEAAYVKPPAELAMVQTDTAPDAVEAPAVTPNFTARQGYLDPAPEGVDASYAWAKPGGRGAGVKVIDVEWGWNFTHEDLVQNQMGVVVGTNSTNIGNINHGTAVLGEISGDKNAFGVTGICPDAIVGASSLTTKRTAQAIVEAADKLSAGDIILLEVHRAGPNAPRNGSQKGYIAIEWWPDDFAAIRYAVNKGIVVVEAAGNGWEDLDDAVYDSPASGFPTSWKNPFNSSNPSSGAIVVGAGNPPNPTHGRTKNVGWNETYVDRARCGFSNWGSRVDAQGWGWEVTSTGYGNLQGGSDRNLWYTDTFSGTSSASPIIVGVIGCLQGIRKAQGASPLSPATLRNLLRSTGSPQQAAPGRPVSQRIGNRPNLKQLIPLVTKAWHHNKKVLQVYASHHSGNCWARIEDIGWRKVQTGTPASITSMFIALCQARAFDRTVSIYIDDKNIYRMYL